MNRRSFIKRLSALIPVTLFGIPLLAKKPLLLDTSSKEVTFTKPKSYSATAVEVYFDGKKLEGFTHGDNIVWEGIQT